jgi:hypothetical protein
MKKENLQDQQTIHRNIIKTMNPTMKNIFQRTTNFKHQNYQRKNKDSNGQMIWIQHYILC